MNVSREASGAAHIETPNPAMEAKKMVQLLAYIGDPTMHPIPCQGIGGI
jgi:hypothetical protein